MIPNTFAEILDCPAFLINLDRQKDRLDLSVRRLRAAGFSNIQRIAGVDGRNIHELLEAWDYHGNPRFDPADGWFNDPIEHPHKQGIMASHLHIWKRIIDERIPIATVFEDDIVFHRDWKLLAHDYYMQTPKDFGICFMGHHCGCGLPFHIVRMPVFALHAYIITLEGAIYLYNKIMTDPKGLRTIDCLLNDYMRLALAHPSTMCNWYAWNAEMFPDPTVQKYPQHAKKDQGLVFQEFVSI